MNGNIALNLTFKTKDNAVYQNIAFIVNYNTEEVEDDDGGTYFVTSVNDMYEEDSGDYFDMKRLKNLDYDYIAYEINHYKQNSYYRNKKRR